MAARTFLAILLCSFSVRAQLVQEAYLNPFDIVYDYDDPSFFVPSYFGSSVSIKGRYAVVGAPNEDDTYFPFRNTAGAAYVFRYDGTNWVTDTRLGPESEEEGSYFGGSVSVLDDTMVIANDSHVFVYEKTVDGRWVRHDTFTSFGGCVALGRDRLVMANPQVVGDATEGSSGAVYVSERTNGVWADPKKVALESDGPFALMSSVAIDGDTLAVSGYDRVSVFVKDGDSWALQASLHAFDAVPGAIAISSNTIVISDYTPTNGISCSVFDREGTNWTQTTVFRPPFDNNVGSLGMISGANIGKLVPSVAVDGDSIIVGSNFNAGSVFLFRRANGKWFQFGPFGASNGSATDWFGVTAAISGEHVIVGAPNKTGGGTGVNPEPGSVPIGAGAAYVFDITTPIILTDLLLSTSLNLKFTGPPNVSNWRVLSGTEPDQITKDDSANFNISESAPGVYQASSSSAQAPRDRAFYQIVKP